MNGIISFGSGWPYAFPSPFPTTFFPTRNSYVVAPFWSDNDIQLEGDVLYEVHERDSDASIQLLDYVSHFIVWWAGNDFSGCWMLVAQWDNVHPYPHALFPFLDPETQAFVSQVRLYTPSIKIYWEQEGNHTPSTKPILPERVTLPSGNEIPNR